LKDYQIEKNKMEDCVTGMTERRNESYETLGADGRVIIKRTLEM
jgi:hypothetical protein